MDSHGSIFITGKKVGTTQGQLAAKQINIGDLSL